MPQYMHTTMFNMQKLKTVFIIEALHVTYYPVIWRTALFHSRQSVITTYHHSLSHSVTNALVSNQLITAFS